MTPAWLLATILSIYVIPGIMWWCVMAYQAWYRGDPIRVEDLTAIPLLMVLWPMWAVVEIWEWLKDRWEQRRLNLRQDHVPISKRVIVQGRLSARVARALKEDIK